MPRQRTELQSLLEDILGSRNVYFQPPESFKIKYPCIIYHVDNLGKVYANNRTYMDKTAYSLVVVDRNPDSDVPKRILDLPYCSFGRFYTADNLNHYTFTIYY